ncbi:protein NLP6 [Lactuca sativa]|uniref:PB1 domain-containing protein n=1 Tax=Lactuca sativa TaxID=4236 RepID=A0A9R1VE81_LACSA|nr:protein NLP6 [Lactuca sativa]KAJ0204500.1 hypothetical protein LSAT_V11C500247030 [Lactuca sativa]
MGDSPTMVNLSKIFRPRRNNLDEVSEDDQLCAFLATFPTKLEYTKPEFYFILWVFWSQQEGSQNNLSFGDPGQWVIHNKIKSSFYKFELTLYDFDGIIQFWAPVNTGGRRFLTTSDQPFAINYLNTGLDKFRLSSLRYRYSIDVNKLDVEDDPMIITGAPASAFLNQLPELVLDLKAHHGCPLVRSAMECDLLAYIVLPICDPSQNCCVGVVECFMKRCDCSLVIFNQLNQALEKVGLRTFDVRECRPYKSIQGLKHAKKDIEEALKIVYESHNLGLAQVWVPYEDEKHVGFSSQTNRTFALKLTGLNNGCFDWSYNNYHNACNMLALRIGDGLAGKTLQNHEPHFCRDISKLSNTDLLVSFTANTKCSCFGICLRSIDTSDFYYVFEFLWPRNRNYVILIESLVLTLKMCLPNFKLASGPQLGDELRIIDVENSTGSKLGHFKIFKGNKLSRIPLECMPNEAKFKTTAIELPRKEIEQQFGTTMKKAAKSLKVSLSTLKRKCKVLGIYEWPGPKFVKRKVNDSRKDQRDMNEEDTGAIVDPSAVKGDINFDESTLSIKVEYADDIIKLHLPLLLVTFIALDKEIGNKLKLNRGSFKLKYLDEDGDWIVLGSEQDMKCCIRSSKKLDSIAIRLRVLPCVHNKYVA